MYNNINFLNGWVKPIQHIYIKMEINRVSEPGQTSFSIGEGSTILPSPLLLRVFSFSFRNLPFKSKYLGNLTQFSFIVPIYTLSLREGLLVKKFLISPLLDLDSIIHPGLICPIWWARIPYLKQGLLYYIGQRPSFDQWWNYTY